MVGSTRAAAQPGLALFGAPGGMDADAGDVTSPGLAVRAEAATVASLPAAARGLPATSAVAPASASAARVPTASSWSSSSRSSRPSDAVADGPPLAVVSRVRCGRIVELDRLIAALTAERASLLVAERDCGEWKKAGYSSFEAWRGQMSGEGLRAARAQVTVAAVLEDSPEAAEAVAAGEVTLVHAEVLGRVRSRAERAGTEALSSGESRELLDLARGQDADTFAKTADRWWARRDSVAHDASHEEIRRRRFLSVSHTAQGTHLKGFLDVVAGRRVQIALEAAMSRPEDGDDRDYSQRLADALADVAERAVNGGSLKTGALVRPHVSVIMTEATFTQARRELRRRAALARTDADGVEPERLPEPVDPVTFEDGTPVPLSEVARILCDAELTRIVIDADDVPINLGRTARLYSREQRRAIIARDLGCQFRGCAQPARWCEVHHIDWWDRDQGVTSIDNGILLCSYHHHEVHRLNLVIHRAPGSARDVRVARARDGDLREPSRPPETTPQPERSQPVRRLERASARVSPVQTAQARRSRRRGLGGTGAVRSGSVRSESVRSGSGYD